MATIKSYSDLQQSKKLADILPLESADMHYCLEQRDVATGYEIGITPFTKAKEFVGKCNIIDVQPSWSLAALLGVLPKDESIDCSISFGYYNGKGEYIAKWLCTFEKEDETKDGFIIETIDGDNPIDVLYEMILELNKLNIL